MSVKTAVISEIQQIAADNRKSLPALTDDLVLLDSGLDSLALAILVVRLEETLGCDPFTETRSASRTAMTSTRFGTISRIGSACVDGVDATSV